MTGEAVCPESIWSFPKGDLEGDFLGLVAVFAEEVECVFEYLEILSYPTM